jgi:hypothetical protein
MKHVCTQIWPRGEQVSYGLKYTFEDLKIKTTLTVIPREMSAARSDEYEDSCVL